MRKWIFEANFNLVYYITWLKDSIHIDKFKTQKKEMGKGNGELRNKVFIKKIEQVVKTIS